MAHDHDIPTAERHLSPEPSERLGRPFQRFAKLSSSGGILLLAMTVVAMVWANSDHHESYEQIFQGTGVAIEVDEYSHHHGDDHAHTDEHSDDGDGHDSDAHGDEGAEDLGDDTPSEPAAVIDEAHDDAAAHKDDHTSDHGEDHADDGHPIFGMEFSIAHWINDLLMAVFFLVVGLEIKREILVGELASPKRAALPIFAAIGGMVAPGLIFAVLNWGEPGLRGWGVPMATDIAFAVGILALLGSRIPNSLKVFLTSLAIVDDLGALMVIAIFYTDQLDMASLGYAGTIVAVLLAMNAMRVRWITLYLVLGIPLWYFIYASGVHATIAGVLLALTIPAHARVDAVNFSYSTRKALEIFDEAGPEDNTSVRQDSTRRAAVFAMIKNAQFVMPPLHRMESALHPWAAFVIIPVFALANAGIPIHGGVGEALGGNISLGIIGGLAIGKPLGIAVACFIAVKLGIASLPKGVSWRHIVGAGALGGIGFTMAIFIANLAYKGNPSDLEHAKLAILAASAISAIFGAGLLLTCKSAPEPEPDDLGPLAND